MLQGMLEDDKFKNHLSLIVVKEDDFCEGKELGCIEIKELGKPLYCGSKEGLVTYDVESSHE